MALYILIRIASLKNILFGAIILRGRRVGVGGGEANALTELFCLPSEKLPTVKGNNLMSSEQMISL